MFYNHGMEIEEKLRLLSFHNDLEMKEEDDCRFQQPPGMGNIYVSHATLPDGRKMRLFKSLISSNCKNNCYYCPMRKDNDHRRVNFEAEEYARIINNLYQSGLIDGAFISSAVQDNSVRTQDILIKAMEILRLKLNFRGYLHVKFMPGLEFDQAKYVMYYADRVSLNLEAPNADRIKYLSPDKTAFNQLIDPLKWTHQIRQAEATAANWKNRWPSVCTQFVVGGSEEQDRELLQTTFYLYTEIHLQRAYFSPLQPCSGTPMESHAAIPLKRKFRLYQASFLMRDYGYNLEDFYFDSNFNLPLEKDPKVIWAEIHLTEHPVEINRADPVQLLRIPGIGEKNAKKIVQLRKIHPFCSESDFSKAGINIQKGLPFITMNGKKSITQPSLPYFLQ
ncbi:MAG: putative DNA modification/repair radical SAM protein [Anaerolineaceae bacterium]|jgi:predicted DNA-binding helix-hairpin-helix protein|nr:MAG: putative DNA modification/repair radical SAM protein [Anaerolineaceae bacterium]